MAIDRSTDDDFGMAVNQILEGIEHVTDYANKATFPDAKLLVFATLLQTRATLLVAARLNRIEAVLVRQQS